MRSLIDHDVWGVVLAGVHAAGDSVSAWLPRPLMPVANSPLFAYGLQWLRAAGVVQTTICANGESRLVRKCIRDGRAFDLDIRYFEDLTPRGPAGCAKDAVLGTHADTIVIIEGSVIPDVDLPALLARHHAAGAALTVVVKPTLPAARAGAPRPVGVYVCDRRALAAVAATGYQDLKELLIPQLYRRGERVLTSPAEGRCPRVTDLYSYSEANALVLERLLNGQLSLAGYERRGRVYQHSSARVAASARLVGPVLVGPGTRVAAGAAVVGPTVLGANCEIEGGALVCRAVLWERCVVRAGACVDGSVLASGTRIDAGQRVSQTLHWSVPPRPRRARGAPEPPREAREASSARGCRASQESEAVCPAR